MERLASVYLHKFTDFPESAPFKRQFGAAIRRANSGLSTDKHAQTHASNNTGPISFAEFVRYLTTVQPKNMNEHWMPASLLCQPCHIEYDFIARFEDLPNSASNVLRRAGLESQISYPDQALFYRGPPVQSSQAEELFSTLSPDLLSKIKMIYHDDFKLFNYDFP